MSHYNGPMEVASIVAAGQESGFVPTFPRGKGNSKAAKRAVEILAELGITETAPAETAAETAPADLQATLDEWKAGLLDEVAEIVKSAQPKPTASKAQVAKRKTHSKPARPKSHKSKRHDYGDYEATVVCENRESRFDDTYCAVIGKVLSNGRERVAFLSREESALMLELLEDGTLEEVLRISAES